MHGSCPIWIGNARSASHSSTLDDAIGWHSRNQKQRYLRLHYREEM